VHVLFNNNYEDWGMRNARRMTQLLGGMPPDGGAGDGTPIDGGTGEGAPIHNGAGKGTPDAPGPERGTDAGDTQGTLL